MKTAVLFALALSVFALGVMVASLFFEQSVPKGISTDLAYPPPTDMFPLVFLNQDVSSPFDHIPESDIEVLSDRVIVHVSRPQWARFTDTNSMDPVIDTGSNAIEIVPKSPDQIHVGDIISYETSLTDGTIIHRVFEVGEDQQGWYALTKGDNNPSPDPAKVRFDDVQRLVVGIIY